MFLVKTPSSRTLFIGSSFFLFTRKIMLPTSFRARFFSLSRGRFFSLSRGRTLAGTKFIILRIGSREFGYGG